jgi:protein-tyrosine phosphatase
LSQGYVDLHCHYVPAVDDGVRTAEEGLALCLGLAQLGYATVVATPHMRAGMFDNDAASLAREHAAFCDGVRGAEGMPVLGLAAEHFCDDVFWERFERGEALPYPGGHALLLELPPERIPLGLPERCFQMQVRGVRPVLAHPERYPPLFRSTDTIARLLEMGVMLQLDLMSLVDRYGRAPRKAAERMLREGAYHLAATDSHRPEHVAMVAEAIPRLRALAGDAYALRLLAQAPAAILAGRADG